MEKETGMDYYKGKCGRNHKIVEGCPECDRLNEIDNSYNAALEEAAKVCDKYESYGSGLRNKDNEEMSLPKNKYYNKMYCPMCDTIKNEDGVCNCHIGRQLENVGISHLGYK